MTYRIDYVGGPSATSLLFQGLLDRDALADLTARARALLRRGLHVSVRLGAGTQVEPGVVDELAQLADVAIEAESAFLAACIRR